MFNPKDFKKKIFSPSINFEEAALELFRFQASCVPVYQQYVSLLNINPTEIKSINEIPFLPISFFKTHELVAANKSQNSNLTYQNLKLQQQTIFSSSGTTGIITSRHYVADLSWYEASFNNGFKYFYGNIQDYCILALLPSYLEREGSSLVYMAKHLIKNSKHPDSGFYLNEYGVLIEKLKSLQHQNQKTILLGVTYALLDLAELSKLHPWGPGGFGGLIIMETGGMKGKRKEMVREELHQQLTSAIGVKQIHSEYGMTELLSQAYSKGHGVFTTPPWMKVLIRDVNDSKTILSISKTGGINIIDLANVYSCAFIATQDLGKATDGEFEILGRFDESDLRGCNLMVD